ncbi:MAG TPA: hypothetical protein VN848_06600 [Gemmatimonadales bacterium]|nr:hypothetical protein [Gemmatimonadales bacterium]
MTTNITPYFGETVKSGSGILATADFSGTTSVAANHGPLGVGGFASAQFQAVTIAAFTGTGSSSASLAGATLVSAIGTAGVKVLGNKPQLGDPCVLYDIGEVKAIAGAALVVGQLVMTDASGRFIPWIDEQGYVPVGEVRVPANSANDVFTMFIYPNTATGEVTLSVVNGITATSGGSKAAAFQLGYGISHITTAANGDSVLLPPALPGAICVVINDGSGTLDVYGQGTDTIDAVATATANIVTNAFRAFYFGLAAGLWASAGHIAVST